MTGPDGSMTNRDNRRNARRAQFEMRQAERHRERERRIRRQRLQRFAIVGGSIIVLLLISFFIIHAVIGSGGTSTPPHHGSYTIPAGVASRDGLEYLGVEEIAAVPRPLVLSGYTSWEGGSPIWRPATSVDTAPLLFVMQSRARNQRMVA
jgi:hypothetical protein